MWSCHSKDILQPVSSKSVDKGKGREPGIVGFAPNPPQEPPFTLPSVEIASQNSTQLWPTRISPSGEPTPRPYQPRGSVGILLGADTDEKLGDLLFRFVEWKIAPPAIDLTVDGLGGVFTPPEGTIISPLGEEMPPDLLFLTNATYSM